MHDLGALWASTRNKGRSIGALSARYIGKRGAGLFLVVIFLLLLMVIAAFAVVELLLPMVRVVTGRQVVLDYVGDAGLLAGFVLGMTKLTLQALDGSGALGTSGVLHAIYFAGCVAWIGQTAGRARWLPVAALLGGSAKVLLEQPWDASFPVHEVLRVAVVPQSHLIGAIVGMATGLVLRRRAAAKPG